MKTYILYWRAGKPEKVSGEDIADAMTHAGYGAGAVPVLDYYEEVEKYNPTSRLIRSDSDM